MYKYKNLTVLKEDLKKYLEYYVEIDPFNFLKNLFASSLSLIVPMASTPKTLLQRGFWPTLRLATILAKILAEKGHLVTVTPLLKKGSGVGRQAKLAAPFRSIAPKFSFYIDYRTATHSISKISIAFLNNSVREKTSQPLRKSETVRKETSQSSLREEGQGNSLRQAPPTPSVSTLPLRYLNDPRMSLRIVLFDDVISTGATLYYAHQTLNAFCALLKIRCQISAITLLKNPKYTPPTT